MSRKKKTEAATPKITSDAIASIKYPAKRKNIPPAGLEAQGVLQESPRIRYEYNPHLPPILRSATEATEADKLPELLAIARRRALSTEEANLLANALRRHEPWLEWSGKREKPWFEVDPVWRLRSLRPWLGTSPPTHGAESATSGQRGDKWEVHER
jgi:adenine-specific DNA-methyltransferase